MKTIIIADIHQRVENVKTILDREKNADEFIFLGDWFDSFHNPPKVTSFRETCAFLRELVLNKKYYQQKLTFCVGNHDLSYIYRNNRPSATSVHNTPEYYCSGVTSSKVNTFRKEFFDKGLNDKFFLRNFQIAYQSQGWTFSHAGVIPQHLPYGGNLKDFVEKDCVDAFNCFRQLRNYPKNYILSDVGECRGGWAQFGGLLWLDYSREFYASSDIGKQVFGHSRGTDCRVTAEETDYESWCLDDEKSYGIIENGKLLIKLI